MVLLLSDRDIEATLDPAACIAAVETAFRRRAEGSAPPAGVHAVTLARGTVHVKTAAESAGAGFLASKVNANFPANPVERGLPTIQGLVVVLAADDGTPVAVMESGSLTRLRTAAATAVAARHLARADASVATIAGCGVQAEPQLRYLHEVRPLRRAMAYDLRPEAARGFAERMSARLGIPVDAVAEPGPACRESDIIITCTPSRSPWLGPRDVPRGAFVAAVGADSPDKQELDPLLFAEGTVLVTDVTSQCAEFGELHHALETGRLSLGQVRAELGQVAAGLQPGRLTPEERIVFDSTGTGIQDAAAAAVVYDRARTLGLGTTFSFRSG